MASLSIWNSSKPKDITDLEWTKQLLNELLDNQITIEKNKLNSEKSVESLFNLRKMEIKKIEVESLNSFPSGYENRNNWGLYPIYDSAEKIEYVCNKAIIHAEQFLESAKKQHEANLPAIENNKLIIEGISKMMEKFGVRGIWSTWEYPTSRSRNKKEVQHYCQYPSELKRFIPTSDGIGLIETAHSRFLDQVKIWKEKKLKELVVIEQAKRNDEIEKLKARTLAKFQVKYDLPASATWDDVWEFADEKFGEDLQEIEQFYFREQW